MIVLRSICYSKGAPHKLEISQNRAESSPDFEAEEFVQCPFEPKKWSHGLHHVFE